MQMSEEETIEIIAALVQLYREQGRYLERIYKWAKRIGVEQIKAQVVDDLDKRRALYDRFVLLANLRPDRSVERTRRRQGRARVRADRRPRTGRGVSP